MQYYFSYKIFKILEKVENPFFFLTFKSFPLIIEKYFYSQHLQLFSYTLNTNLEIEFRSKDKIVNIFAIKIPPEHLHKIKTPPDRCTKEKGPFFLMFKSSSIDFKKSDIEIGKSYFLKEYQVLEDDVLNLTSPDKYELVWYLPEDNGEPIDFFEISFYPVTFDDQGQVWNRQGDLFRTEVPHPGNVRYIVQARYKLL